MPDDDFVGCPGEDVSVYGIAIVVRSYADPVTTPEADILRLWRPLAGLTWFIDFGNFDRLVRRHFGEIAVPNGRDSLVPGIDHACESDQLIYLAAAVLPREPNRMIS